MEFKEVEKPAMKFIGLGVNTSVEDASKKGPIIWKEFMEKYNPITDSNCSTKTYGVCTGANEKECTFRYIACAESDNFKEIPEGMESVEIPSSKYLIFIHKGKISTLGETYGKIMQEIFKINKKQKDFWIELYDERWKEDSEESEMELWIAVE